MGKWVINRWTNIWLLIYNKIKCSLPVSCRLYQNKRLPRLLVAVYAQSVSEQGIRTWKQPSEFLVYREPLGCLRAISHSKSDCTILVWGFTSWWLARGSVSLGKPNSVSSKSETEVPTGIPPNANTIQSHQSKYALDEAVWRAKIWSPQQAVQ